MGVQEVSDCAEVSEMTDLSKLADKLRKFRYKPDDQLIGPLYAAGAYDAYADAANAIEAALPEWTKITADPDTWPPIGPAFIAQPENTKKYTYDPVFTSFDEQDTQNINGWIDAWWRPLCSLDYPPDQQPDMENDDG